MSKYIIIIGIVVVIVIMFLVFKNKRNNYVKVDSYQNIKESLKNIPNKAEAPVANIEELDREVNNGGFNQYFFNSSGQNCFETLRELKRVGENKKAELLEAAIGLINPNKQSEEVLIEKIRKRQIPELDNDVVNAKLDSLDQIFFKTAE